VRPRTALYGVLFAVVAVLMIWGLATRPTLDLNVIRDRSPPFVRLSDGSIRNDYALKLINMSAAPRRLAISVEGLEGARLRTASDDGHGHLQAQAQADSVTNVRVHVVAPGTLAPGSHGFVFVVRDLDNGDVARSESAFLAGDPR
jgi:polyferredoxin